MNKRFTLWPMTFEQAIKRIMAFNPNELHPQEADRAGYCCALLSSSGWKLMDTGLHCSRRARFSAIVHLSEMPGDELFYPGLCGQHIRTFENRGWRVESIPLKGALT